MQKDPDMFQTMPDPPSHSYSITRRLGEIKITSDVSLSFLCILQKYSNLMICSLWKTCWFDLHEVRWWYPHIIHTSLLGIILLGIFYSSQCFMNYRTLHHLLLFSVCRSSIILIISAVPGVFLNFSFFPFYFFFCFPHPLSPGLKEKNNHHE